MQSIPIPILFDPAHEQKCRNLADKLGSTLVMGNESVQETQIVESGFLCFDKFGRLGLVESRANTKRPAIANFDLKRTNHGIDPLIRAIGYKTKRVIDCTAGYGVDAAHIASLGIDVLAIERHPAVYALLEDAVLRCQSPLIRKHLTIIFGDCRSHLEQLKDPVEVIYLDPMYPPKNASAAPKKSLRILQQIIQLPQTAAETVELSRRKVSRRVVVKRPNYATPLASGKSGQTGSKLVRFDIYPPAR